MRNPFDTDDRKSFREMVTKFLETEIWPNIINSCKEKDIYTALVNARLSEKSKNDYIKYSSLIQPAIDSIDTILAQFESDKNRFQELSPNKKINYSKFHSSAHLYIAHYDLIKNDLENFPIEVSILIFY